MVTVVIWGTTFVFTKLLLIAGLTAAQIFTLRFLIAYVLLLLYSLCKPSFRLLAYSVKDELLMLALGVTGGSLYFLTENTALNYTTTTNTSLIVCQCPLFAALLVSIFYKSQRLNAMQTLGTVVAAIGVVVVVLNGHFILHLSPLGDLLALTACLCWAFYSLLMIPAARRYSTSFITRKVFFYGLVSMVPYFMLRPEMPQWEVICRPDVMWNLIFLGSIASLACFLAWNWVMKRLGVVVTTNYVYLNPVVTIVFAWIILSEQITVYLLLGTVLILAGMYLADRKSLPAP